MRARTAARARPHASAARSSHLPKADLVAWCAARGIAVSSTIPSNADPRFARARLRAACAGPREREGLTAGAPRAVWPSGAARDEAALRSAAERGPRRALAARRAGRVRRLRLDGAVLAAPAGAPCALRCLDLALTGRRHAPRRLERLEAWSSTRCCRPCGAAAGPRAPCAGLLVAADATGRVTVCAAPRAPARDRPHDGRAADPRRRGARITWQGGRPRLHWRGVHGWTGSRAHVRLGAAHAKD